MTDESAFVEKLSLNEDSALERLVNDPSKDVQMRVAEHGYGFDPTPRGFISSVELCMAAN